MTYTVKQMEERIEWLQKQEAAFRFATNKKYLSTDSAANTIAEAIGIIAELAGRLSAAEELLVAARQDLKSARRR